MDKDIRNGAVGLLLMRNQPTPRFVINL